MLPSTISNSGILSRETETRGAAAYKPEDRTGFRHKRFMYYIRWEKVRKSKDNKKIWEKTGKAAKEAGAQREREQ